MLEGTRRKRFRRIGAEHPRRQVPDHLALPVEDLDGHVGGAVGLEADEDAPAGGLGGRRRDEAGQVAPPSHCGQGTAGRHEETQGP